MLKLLTEDELESLHYQDIQKQRKENIEDDTDFNMNRYTRKWKSKVSDAKKYWDQLKQIDNKQLLEVINWLSISDEPCHGGSNKPTKIERLARVVKYEMSPKQRAIAYSIITDEYNKRGIKYGI